MKSIKIWYPSYSKMLKLTWCNSPNHNTTIFTIFSVFILLVCHYSFITNKVRPYSHIQVVIYRLWNQGFRLV